MAVERQDRDGVGGTDIEELDVVVTGCCEPSLVGRYTEAVDLRIGMLDGARADAGEGFPKADGVVVAGCAENYGHDVAMVSAIVARSRFLDGHCLVLPYVRWQ